MEKARFSIKIKAPREKVWKVLWDDVTYRQWTRPFMEGSYAESDWNEGSKILFLSPGGDGMYSRIARKIDNEIMSFEHQGVMKSGREMPLDDDTRKWSGSQENYTLKETDGSTELTVELDMNEEYQKYFQETFPKALEQVRVLAES